LYVWDRLPFRNSASVKGSVVSARPPNTVLFRYEMQGGRPCAFGASGCAVLQHGVKLSLGHDQAFRNKAAWAAVYWMAGCCSNVVSGVLQFGMSACRLCQLWKFL
jgi:hypothetical protein